MTRPDPPSQDTTLDATSAGATVAGQVAVDVPCHECGYNLRGLATIGQCPECGAPVAASLRGTLLQFSSPRWIRALRLGTQLIVVGTWLAILGLGANLVIRIGTRKQTGILMVAAVVGQVLGLIGTWLLTERDPSGRGEDDYGTARKLARACLVLSVLRLCISLLERFAPPPLAVSAWLKYVMAGLAVTGVVGTVAELQYVGKLARRLPDGVTERTARWLRYALGATDAVQTVLLVALTLLLPKAGPGTRALIPFACGMLVVMTISAGFELRYAQALLRFGQRLTRAVAAAERNAAATAPPPPTRTGE